jgi:LPS O-antigen subunit length determinant protein (WzzB/FepE family)
LFFLVYGSEAVLPTDLEYGSPRLKAYNEQDNDVARENALDQLKEACDVALFNRISDTTTKNTFADEISTSMTWCFTEAKATRDDTSLLRHGKDRTSSQKY